MWVVHIWGNVQCYLGPTYHHFLYTILYVTLGTLLITSNTICYLRPVITTLGPLITTSNTLCYLGSPSHHFNVMLFYLGSPCNNLQYTMLFGTSFSSLPTIYVIWDPLTTPSNILCYLGHPSHLSQQSMLFGPHYHTLQYTMLFGTLFSHFQYTILYVIWGILLISPNNLCYLGPITTPPIYYVIWNTLLSLPIYYVICYLGHPSHLPQQSMLFGTRYHNLQNTIPLPKSPIYYVIFDPFLSLPIYYVIWDIFLVTSKLLCYLGYTFHSLQNIMLFRIHLTT